MPREVPFIYPGMILLGEWQTHDDKEQVRVAMADVMGRIVLREVVG